MRECILLAGGFGTRLKTVLSDKPKCLAPITEQITFLDILVKYLINQNVTKIIFSLGYLSHMVVDYVESKNYNINCLFITEEEPLGTGGAILNALVLTETNDVLILNADTFFNIDLDNFFQNHILRNSKCTISLKKMYDFDRYGIVEFNDDYSIVKFIEKKFSKSGFINGGVIILNKPYFMSFNLPNIFSFEKDFLEKVVEIDKIFSFISDSYFIDIGIPKDYAKAINELKVFI